jgi:hypothetical protein
MLPRRCSHEHEGSLNGHLASRQNNPPSALATLLQHRAARARESQAQHWLTPLGPPVLTRISNESARGKLCCGTGALMVQPVTSQAAPAV